MKAPAITQIIVIHAQMTITYVKPLFKNGDLLKFSPYFNSGFLFLACVTRIAGIINKMNDPQIPPVYVIKV
jgi:hypothetical protein